MPRILLLLLCLFALTTANTRAAEPEGDQRRVTLKVGDKAPQFEGRTDEGKAWKSKDHVGKKVLIVYFYPADMTGGCTKQACLYRDALKDVKRDDVEVIGVSGDSVENHQHFKKEHELNFTLLADEEGKIAKAFGVKTAPGGVFNWSKDGEEIPLERGVTAMRWTFVIDRDGKIAYKNDKVDPTKDAAQALAAVEKLAKE